MLFPNFTSAHENGKASPGDQNQFPQEILKTVDGEVLFLLCSWSVLPLPSLHDEAAVQTYTRLPDG